MIHIFQKHKKELYDIAGRFSVVNDGILLLDSRLYQIFLEFPQNTSTIFRIH